MTIRPARSEDLSAIQHIYAHAVETGKASFELTAPNLDEMTARYERLITRSYPYVVIEVDGEVAGFAYAGPFRERPAYRWIVEDSVYLAPEHAGKGLGKALLENLLSRCEASGFRQMIAIIGDSANLASIGVHRSLGFEHVGTMKHTGWKFNQWIDTVIMQKILGNGGSTPADPDELPMALRQ